MKKTNNAAAAINNKINAAANNAAASPSDVPLKEILRRGWARPEVPIAIIGDPGTGKTSQIEAFCEEYNLPLVKVLASSMDETDVSGILVYDPDSDTAVLKRNEMFVRLMERGGVLFLDEINTARKEVADTLLTLIQSRELPGGYKLPSNTLIVAAMNDAEQCDNYDLSPAMRNRFLWVEKRATFDEWFSFQFGDGTEQEETPAPLEKPISQREFISWLRQKGNGEDKKEVLRLAHEKGLDLSRNEAIVGNQTFTSPRSLSNLVYWTKDADDMAFWAPCFITEDDATVIKAVAATAVKNVANSIFDDGINQIDDPDAEELFRSNIQDGVLKRVKSQIKGI